MGGKVRGKRHLPGQERSWDLRLLNSEGGVDAFPRGEPREKQVPETEGGRIGVVQELEGGNGGLRKQRE